MNLPDLLRSVLRVGMMKVLQSLHHSRRALHVSVVDHDITCDRTQSQQIIKLNIQTSHQTKGNDNSIHMT